ncbi:hypothetical protein [Flavobacterium sediminis]|nr:hypothetical protein [Flavobacterium sediminis]
MRKYNKLLFALALTSVFVACQDDEDPNNPIPYTPIGDTLIQMRLVLII